MGGGSLLTFWLVGCSLHSTVGVTICFHANERDHTMERISRPPAYLSVAYGIILGIGVRQNDNNS